MTDDGVVRLRMLGSCDGCPSSSVTLTLAVRDRHPGAPPRRSAASRWRRRPAGGAVGHPGVGAALAARRARPRPVATWTAVDGLGDLAAGAGRRFSVAGMPSWACGSAPTCSPTGTRCPVCGGEPRGRARSARRLGGAAGDAVLRCPACARALRRPPRGTRARRHRRPPRAGAAAGPRRRRRAGRARGGGRMTRPARHPLAVLAPGPREPARRPAPRSGARCAPSRSASSTSTWSTSPAGA